MPGLYSHTTRSTGTILTAAIYNGDHQNHIDNHIPTAIDDYSATAVQMQTITDPGEAGTESLPTSLAGELERLRFAIKEIKTQLGFAPTHWFSSPSGAGTVPTGATFSYVGSSAPAGYVLLSGRTIGNAASGATERANADTELLFTLLWNSMSNSEAPVSGGRGASAASDFAANKTITLPDQRGRQILGKDDMGGAAAGRITNSGDATAQIAGTTLGASGGVQAKTISTSYLPAAGLSIPGLSIPSLSVSGTVPNVGFSSTGGALTHHVTDSAGDEASSVLAISGSTGTGTTGTGTTGNMGSGTSFGKVDPSLVLNVIIKL